MPESAHKQVGEAHAQCEQLKQHASAAADDAALLRRQQLALRQAVQAPKARPPAPPAPPRPRMLGPSALCKNGPCDAVNMWWCKHAPCRYS